MWKTFFGDIQLGYDLDARDNTGVGFKRWFVDFVEETVNPIADDELLFEGLDMNIAGAFLKALSDQAIDKTDDRRFVRGIDQVCRFQVAGQGSGSLSSISSITSLESPACFS